MINGTLVDIASYENNLNEVVKERKKLKDEKDLIEVKNLVQKMPENKQVKINRILEGRCSTWLLIIPTHDNFFAMSCDEFRDALAVR